MSKMLTPQGPNDAAARKVGTQGGAAKPRTAVPEDTSAMALGKQAARSGLTANQSAAPRDSSHPIAVAAQGTPSASNGSVLTSKLKRG